MTASRLEQLLMWQIVAAGLPAPETEYVFARPRRFRFDFAWPAQRISAEVDGGTWMAHGRHVTGAGAETDSEKYCLAACMGWRVLRFTGAMVEDGRALRYLERALGEEKSA